MYTEETKKSIDWGNLLKKSLVIILIVLVIFFVIWLFAKNNNSNNNINVYDGNGNNVNNQTNVIESLEQSNAYSKDYLEGYRYFHDTAKEYFLISELPTTGKTIKYTLQELIDKGLIFAWEYKDGKSCDTEASYVSVTNVGGKYKYTVTLVCGTEVAKTTEDLGCNQLCNQACPSGNCNVTVVEDKYVTEYRYRQPYTATETVYTCPAGYTRNGTKCVKNNETTINATKNVVYECPTGYTKSGSGADTKCYKTTEDVINATPKTTYSCPAGYTQSGSGANTKCYKTDSDSEPAQYSYVYSCPSGYTKSGSGSNTKCIKSTTVTAKAEAKTTYSCPSGYTLSGTKCTRTVSGKVSTSTSYSCPSGTPVNGGKSCRTYSSKSYYQSYEIYHGTSYNGCSYSGSYTDSCSAYSGCTRTYYKYYCSTSSYKDVDAKQTTTYSCPSGYTKSGSGSSTKCTKTESINGTATTTYSCPDGYTKSGSGSSTKCTKSSTDTINATKTKDYYCPVDGDILIGDRCYYNYSSSKNPTVKTTYSCPDGYTLSGTKCTSSGKDTKSAIKNTTYSCPSGYTKIGTGSEAKCMKGNIESINATKKTQSSTKYKYKWSTETSLAGWERTGETRQSKVAGSTTTNSTTTTPSDEK